MSQALITWAGRVSFTYVALVFKMCGIIRVIPRKGLRVSHKSADHSHIKLYVSVL